VRTSGLLSRNESANSEATTNSPAISQSQSDTKTASSDSKGTTTKNTKSEESNQAGLRNAEDVARLVWGFFGTAGTMVEEMMGIEDEVKLLRLRTRRNELVIVPGMSQV
jgi:dynein light chain roadblock-type